MPSVLSRQMLSTRTRVLIAERRVLCQPSAVMHANLVLWALNPPLIWTWSPPPHHRFSPHRQQHTELMQRNLESWNSRHLHRCLFQNDGQKTRVTGVWVRRRRTIPNYWHPDVHKLLQCSTHLHHLLSQCFLEILLSLFHSWWWWWRWRWCKDRTRQLNKSKQTSYKITS